MRLLFILVVLICCPRLSATELVDIQKENTQGTWLGQYIYYYIGNDSIEDIASPAYETKFIPSREQIIRYEQIAPGQAYHRLRFWFRISFKNSANVAQEIVIDRDQFRMKSVELYHGTTFVDRLQSGDRRHDRYFRLNIAANSIETFYFYVQPNLIFNFSLRFWTDVRFYYEAVGLFDKNAVMSISVVMMAALFNILLCFSYREKVHLYYLGYLLSYLLWLISVWTISDMPWGENDGVGFFGSTTSLFVMLFSIHFLNLKQYGWLNVVARFLVLCSLFCMVLSLFDPQLGFRVIQLMSVIGSPFCLYCGIYTAWRSRKAHLYIYCLAYGSMLTGVVLTILYNLYLLKDPAFEGSMQFGMTIEAVLMLIAIGHKIWSTERELRHNQKQLAKVFFPHQLEQIKQGLPLEATMPIGEHVACILAFDVIESSKVKHPDFADTLEDFLSRCRLLMTDHYDGKNLISNGYIVKEMGDGFLCSVGFPFRAIGPSLEVCAIELAERVAAEFAKAMSKLTENEPIYCSIAIAKGSVRGYFSKSGAIRHDLWGPAIVHAVRYESLRRRIFKVYPELRGSILILQEAVYQCLPAERRQPFQVMPLKANGMQVRDDESATCLAYRQLEQVSLRRTGS